MLTYIGMSVFILVLVLVLVLLTPAPASAEGDRCAGGTTPSTQCIADAKETTFFSGLFRAGLDADGEKRAAQCYCCGNCGLNDAVGTIITVSRFIFGIAGSLALLMIMYGGFQWLTAAGSSERVKKGTETLTHAAVGLAIIFGAWMLVNFILIAITGQQVGSTGVANLMNGDWFKVE